MACFMGLSLFWLVIVFGVCSGGVVGRRPLVINTWPWPQPTQEAWDTLTRQGASAMDALVAGCSVAEEDLVIPSVGWGGSPDETGETTLDAMVMDGVTHDVGSVGCLKNVREASAVARAVMEYTTHTLLVGESATDFAISMGFNRSDLHSNRSQSIWNNWKNRNCQPNYRQNVTPDPKENCGPYIPDTTETAKSSEENKQRLKFRPYSENESVYKTPSRSGKEQRYNRYVDENHHDTIGMIILDQEGNLVVGTSTNGATHKVPGRVGDSPITGSGAYLDNDVGAAAATGDGDVMMRFLPSFHVVELMRAGHSPAEASQMALQRIVAKYPNFSGALVAVTKSGEYGAACKGFGNFRYCVRNDDMADVTIETVSCMP